MLNTGDGPAAADVERGRVAYTAYVESVSGHSPITGDKLPDFSDCPGPVWRAWIAAAAAVIAHQQ